MAIIKQDNTIFNVSSDVIFTAGGKYANSSKADAGGYNFDAEYFAENPNDLSKSFNAVEIDWNNAQLGNKVDSSTLTPGEEIIIQTTGQLLSYMSTIARTTEN